MTSSSRRAWKSRLHFNVRDLSAGAKQRVAIARALANRPRLLLADEPTANLDSESGSEVMTLLRGLVRERGSEAVVVSHDDRLRAIADRVLWLRDGHLSEEERRLPMRIETALPSRRLRSWS